MLKNRNMVGSEVMISIYFYIWELFFIVVLRIVLKIKVKSCFDIIINLFCVIICFLLFIGDIFVK